MSAAQTLIEDFALRDNAPAPRGKLAAIIVLAALGDILLFGEAPGIAGVLFAVAVEIAAVLAARASARKAAISALVGVATLAPLIEDANVLSLAIAVFGAAAIALIANDRMRGSFAERLLRVLKFLALGPFRILVDLPALAPSVAFGALGKRFFLAWAIPIVMGGVFLTLLSDANPIIAAEFADIDLRSLLVHFDIGRIAFWLALLSIVWPFVLFRLPEREGVDAPHEHRSAGAGGRAASLFFGEAAILRSLILFNAMFAVQTALDAAILWGGHSLPAGVSFASYAHRGAYPLVVTALLAGAFVIIAMRPGTTASRSIPIRALVYVWIAQNVALVLSSLYRLDLYVRVYSLTYWRAAAFVWMGLVAVGLVLLVVQLSTGRPNRWLATANVIAAAVALYCCALVNFDYLIADFNLRHCREVSGESASLDTAYLSSLGPDAIPAIDAAVASFPPHFVSLTTLRSNMLAALKSNSPDWRTWTFRKSRLSRYVDAQEEISAKP